MYVDGIKLHISLCNLLFSQNIGFHFYICISSFTHLHFYVYSVVLRERILPLALLQEGVCFWFPALPKGKRSFCKSQWLCYDATSALCSSVFWPQACGSVLPEQGSNPHPLQGRRSFNRWTPRKAPRQASPCTSPGGRLRPVSSKCGPSTSSRSTWDLVRHTSSAPSPDSLG